MAYTFIVSTPHHLFRPLAWQGITAQSAYDQLIHILSVRLGDEQSAILAEPVNGEEAVDWYAKAPGTPLLFSTLSPAEQEKVSADLTAFHNKAAALAARLKQEDDSNSLIAGNLLELALAVPSPDYLYALRSNDGNLSPLLVGWGCALADATVEPAAITRLLAASASTDAGESADAELNRADMPDHSRSAQGEFPKTSAAAPGETAVPAPELPIRGNAGETVIRHVFPFPWAMLAFLLAVSGTAFLLFWLLPYAGASGDSGLTSCTRRQPEAVSPNPVKLEELYRAQGREKALRDELAYLHKEYELRLGLCEQPIEPAPVEPEPEPAPPLPELALPELPPDPTPVPQKPTLPKAEAKPEAKPQPQPDIMVIPDNPTDLSFLEGCWYAQTGLKSSRTNMPISVKYCFDKQGNGSITLTERDRRGREVQVCKGGARARLNNGKLYIQDLGARCPDGSNYERENINCRNADQSKALCTGVGERSGRKNWWDKPFTRTDR